MYCLSHSPSLLLRRKYVDSLSRSGLLLTLSWCVVQFLSLIAQKLISGLCKITFCVMSLLLL
jgi:hypothetical protein